MPVSRRNDRQRRTSRRLLLGVAALVAVFVALECIARFALGLGDPPLYVADSQIEYLYKPSSAYRRFGRRLAFNAYSMRSDDFPLAKQDPNEVRALFLGDSVIHGGNLTDQAELATEILKARLTRDLNRPVVVRNVSAGSWGPGNLLAYVQRYGLFNADVVVILISSHDCGDVPTFIPLVGVRADYPDHTPLLACQELYARYWPMIVAMVWPSNEAPESEPVPTLDDQRRSLDDLGRLIAIVERSGAALVVAQHLEQGELGGHEMPGYGKIRELFQSRGIQPINLGPAFSDSLKTGMDPYRDRLHPNAQGQRLIAETLYQPIVEALTTRQTLLPRANPRAPGSGYVTRIHTTLALARYRFGFSES